MLILQFYKFKKKLNIIEQYFLVIYLLFFCCFFCTQQGYFQLKAYPGSFVLQLRNGRSASIYKIDR